MTTNVVAGATVNYRAGQAMPAWVREVIAAHLAIEGEDARSAGAIGYMARALVVATMPYKDPKADVFKRMNGDFALRIVAGYEGGLPYGVYPRLLVNWVASEAVRTKSPEIELGDSLRLFLRDVLDIRSSTGGKQGSATRVSEQMKRLFGSLITAQYSGSTGDKRPFVLKNVLLAEELSLDDRDMKMLDDEGNEKELWVPQERHVAGTWQSRMRLTDGFFRECITTPVPVDLRAYKALRGSPLAMDIYAWLTYRLSYTERQTRPIPFEALMMQFGSGYGSKATTPAGIKQGVLDFKRGFLAALKLVLVVYPLARVEVAPGGLVLFPSPTHVSPVSQGQGRLF
jgi:hypothetical protein